MIMRTSILAFEPSYIHVLAVWIRIYLYCMWIGIIYIWIIAISQQIWKGWPIVMVIIIIICSQSGQIKTDPCFYFTLIVPSRKVYRGYRLPSVLVDISFLNSASPCPSILASVFLGFFFLYRTESIAAVEVTSLFPSCGHDLTIWGFSLWKCLPLKVGLLSLAFLIF